MTITGCDLRALQVARQLHREQQPELTVLFGSRARGDYQDELSDIDILLIRDNKPDLFQKNRIDEKAGKLARSIYGHSVEVHTLWHTTEEFDQMRRTVNHVVARALQDGIIMPGNPEEDASQYNNDTEDYSYEWTVTGERLRHAEQHLFMFNLAIDSQRGDMDEMIGQQAHAALEHAIKAIISALGWQYKTIHNLNELVGDLRRADPDFRFRLTISGQTYNQYAGRDEYERTGTRLTQIPGYADATRGDVQRLLDRAKEVQENRP